MQAVIIASERLTLAAEDWLTVPPNTILVVHPRGPVLLVPVQFDANSALTLLPLRAAQDEEHVSCSAQPDAGAVMASAATSAHLTGTKRRRQSCDESNTTNGASLLFQGSAANSRRLILTALELNSGAEVPSKESTLPCTTTAGPPEDSRHHHHSSHVGLGHGQSQLVSTQPIYSSNAPRPRNSTPQLCRASNTARLESPRVPLASIQSPSLRVQMYCTGTSFEQQAVAVTADSEFADPSSMGDGAESYVMRCTGVPGVLPRLPRADPAPIPSLNVPSIDRVRDVDAPADGVRWMHQPHSSRHHHYQFRSDNLRGDIVAVPVHDGTVDAVRVGNSSSPRSAQTLHVVGDSASVPRDNLSKIPLSGPASVSLRGDPRGCWIHPALLEDASDLVIQQQVAYRPLSSLDNPAEGIFASDDTFGNLTPNVFGHEGLSSDEEDRKQLKDDLAVVELQR